MRVLTVAALALLFSSRVLAARVNVDQWYPGEPGPSYYKSPVHHSPELHIIGAYGPDAEHRGLIRVKVQSGSEPLVLVASSYETALWSFTIAPGANVQGIILNGYHPQQITGAGNVPVTNLSPHENWLGSGGYKYGESNTSLLISNAQTFTGLTLESFGGAYQPSFFSIVVPEPAVFAPLAVSLLLMRRLPLPRGGLRLASQWAAGTR